ncbi:hypothetical protein Hanom_Chr10g00915561 [Helianthus anomalus]
MIFFPVSRVGMSSVSTDTDTEIPVTVPVKVSIEFVFKIFRFGKFSTSTQYHLLVSDHGFHTNNIITIKLFWLIFFRLSFSAFSIFSFYSC